MILREKRDTRKLGRDLYHLKNLKLDSGHYMNDLQVLKKKIES